jgi:hypothetical protein
MAIDTIERTGRRRVSARLQARARRHRIEAPCFALPVRPLTALGQDEELGMCGGEAGGRRGLGQMRHTHSLPRERLGKK